jgi:asparagine synthase (glutamine-hydrolysing)
MGETVAHRGPDDWGIVTLHGSQVQHRSLLRPEGEGGQRVSFNQAAGTVILGHRRLAIIDLSSNGHQPMSTADGRLWITFNGEIYNYRQLREELESDGVTFRSQSDTEVVLALYAREGPRCLAKLRGMFAFALWDEASGELFMARDRFGIKPFYYAQGPSGLFLFASELGAVLSSGYVSTEIDHDAEIVFLRRGSISAPRTFYRNIQALPPGHWARWNGRELSVEAYWSLSEVLSISHRPPPAPRRPSDIAEQFRQALIESVKAHLVSDVPVGVFLSGGLDSTAVVAAIRQFYSGPLRTFTISFPGMPGDEGNLARQAAAYFGTDHTEIEVTKDDFYQGLDDVFSAMDQTTVDGVNTYFVAKSARQAGCKVALSGLGGDEILGGYKSFVVVPRLKEFLRVVGQAPWLSQPAARLAEHVPASWASKLAQLLKDRPDDWESLWHGYRALFTDEQIGRLVSRPLSVVRCPWPAVSDQPSATADQVFWAVAYFEMNHFMIPQLLRDSDVFTMCHGLELRTPFVDHVFLGAIHDAGLWPREGAPSYKLALFRQLKEFLPPAHLDQGKMGFTLPFEVWLKEALVNGASSALSRDLQSMLDQPQYRPFVEAFAQGKMHWSRVWGLYVLERFRARATREV